MVVSLLAAFSVGFFVITNRYMCADLSKRADNRLSIVANNVSALITLGIVFIFTGTAFNIQALSITSSNFYMLGGGFFFILAISLSNYLAPKVPILAMTVTMFLGKLFAGLLLDYFLLKVFSPGLFFGGLLVAFGLWFSKKSPKPADPENEA